MSSQTLDKEKLIVLDPANKGTQPSEKKDIKFKFQPIDHKLKHTKTLYYHCVLGLLLGFSVRRFLFLKTFLDIKIFKGKVNKKYPGSFMGTMNAREARLILNLKEGASAKAIRQAHIKLMLLNHPDSGGSTFLASKINEAKDLLTQFVEESTKGRGNNEDGSEDFLKNYFSEDRIINIPESERLVLDVLFGKKTEFTETELKQFPRKIRELREKERLQREAEEQENKVIDDYEHKNISKQEYNYEDELGLQIDKNSEFYKKNKEKIENLDFLDENDPINNWSLKIIRDKAPKI